jgi:MFS family permease
MAIISEPAAASPASPASRMGFYPWYVIGVLMLIYTSSFVDRTIISLLVAPIRADLKITDTQMSLVSGLSFAIFYTVLGLPLGRLADRYSRRVIIMIGVTLWSIMTMTCGLANTFSQLFLARVGVGVGEASLTPSAYSLIPDLFPKDRLARAFGVYNIGIGLGSGLALVLGGLVIDLVQHSPPVILPVLGAVKPWQLVFLAVGAPGVVLALIMMTVREPARRDMIANDTGRKPASLPVRRVLSYLWSIRRAYFPLVAAFCMTAVESFGYAAWIPSSFIRSHGWTAAEAGERYGLVVLVTGISGAVLGGWFADRLTARGIKSAYIRMTMYACACVLPFAVLAPLVPGGLMSLLLFAGMSFFNSCWLGAFSGAIQLLVPNQMRGQTTALTLLFTSIFGFGLGPLFIARFTDGVFHSDAMLGASMASVGAIAVPLAILFLWTTEKAFGRAVVAAEAWTSPDRTGPN